MPSPDFVGVGTQNAGGGWWHDLLLLHPSIAPPHGGDKELHFFDQFCARPMTDEDVRRYHDHFPQRDETISGEWTPRYMYDPWTPLLLRRAAPDATLLVMLGDPFQRYRSRLARARSEADPDEEELYMADAAGRGRYATQLRRLYDVFDRSAVLVLQHEQCRLDPLGEYRRTLRFLGLGDEHVPRRVRRMAASGTRRRHAVRALRAVRVLRPPPSAELWPDIEAALHDELDPEMAELRSLVPGLRLELWPSCAHLA